jgi:rubrerythrin
MAVETEKSGRQFYEAAARQTQNQNVSGLFTFLAKEEAIHEQKFQALYQTIRESPIDLPYNWDEVVEYLKVISDSRFFLTPGKALSLASEAGGPVEALNAALQFEKETMLFYLEIAGMVAARHRSVVDEIVHQERAHMRKLSDLLQQTRRA